MDDVKTVDESGMEVNEEQFNEMVGDDVQWTDERLDHFTNLKLEKVFKTIDKDAYWKVVKCTGMLEDGSFVPIAVPFTAIPLINKYDVDKGFLIEIAKSAGVYAKGKGLFRAITTS